MWGKTSCRVILTSFSVLTEDQVAWVESSSTTNMCPLLTIVGHVEGDATLWQKQMEDFFTAFFSFFIVKTRKCTLKKHSPVSETHKECGPLCSALSSSDRSSKPSLWRAEQGRNTKQPTHELSGGQSATFINQGWRQTDCTWGSWEGLMMLPCLSITR